MHEKNSVFQAASFRANPSRVDIDPTQVSKRSLLAALTAHFFK